MTRVQAEADIMVGLEALKNEISIIKDKLRNLISVVKYDINMVENRHIQTGTEQDMLRDVSR